MELQASQDALARDLGNALLAEFGVLVPEHTGEGGVSPFPFWVNP
jgi:hypothetical protein